MAENSNSPVRLNKLHVKPAAQVLARALQDDPLFIYFFPDAARDKKLSLLFQLPVRYGVLCGEVYATSPELEGIVVWLPSEKADMSPWGMLRSGGISMPFKMSMGGMKRMMRWMDYVNAVHRRIAPFPHQYLQLLGVDPAFQGKGYAGVLLKPMFVRLDEKGLPCYLETLNPTNLPIYQHYGFKVAEQGYIPGTEAPFWVMLRQPVNPQGIDE